MSPEEFDIRFDILYNNITSNQAPGLNEYEKSMFLTKAMNELIKNKFYATRNNAGVGYDTTSKRQIELNGLVTLFDCSVIDDSTIIKLDKRSIAFNYPDNIMFSLNEVLNASDLILQVRSLDFEEYSTLMSKPYQRPLKRQAWKLMNSNMNGKAIVEIILPKSDMSSKGIEYTIKYIRYPKPIIVGDLSKYSSSIDGYSSVTECELDESVHEEILQRAVELAKTAYMSNANELQLSTTIGQRSE